jgi:hypothetical protein
LYGAVFLPRPLADAIYADECSFSDNSGHCRILLYNSVVGDALARFVGNETAVRFNASRQVPTAEDLRLATEAGFSAVDARISRIDVHLPRLDKFVLDHLAATPIASIIVAADPGARKKIGASVMEQLRRYADGDGITYSEETRVLKAEVR